MRNFCRVRSSRPKPETVKELCNCCSFATDKSKEENASGTGNEDSDDDDQKDVDDEEDVLDDESEEYLARLEKVHIPLGQQTDFRSKSNVSDIYVNLTNGPHCCHTWTVAPILYNGLSLPPSKFLLRMGDLQPHQIRGS